MNDAILQRVNVQARVKLRRGCVEQETHINMNTRERVIGMLVLLRMVRMGVRMIVWSFGGFLRFPPISRSGMFGGFLRFPPISRSGMFGGFLRFPPISRSGMFGGSIRRFMARSITTRSIRRRGSSVRGLQGRSSGRLTRWSGGIHNCRGGSTGIIYWRRGHRRLSRDALHRDAFLATCRCSTWFRSRNSAGQSTWL